MQDKMPVKDLLRRASDRMATADYADDYLNHPPADGRYGVTVDWTWGTSEYGGGQAKAALKEKIQWKVSQALPDMLRTAAAELREEAQQALSQVRNAMDDV